MEIVWLIILGAFVGWATPLALRGEDGGRPSDFLFGALGGLLGEAAFHLAQIGNLTQIHFRVLPAVIGSLLIVYGGRLWGRSSDER